LTVGAVFDDADIGGSNADLKVKMPSEARRYIKAPITLAVGPDSMDKMAAFSSRRRHNAAVARIIMSGALMPAPAMLL
jgi:hypothetical protein